MLDGVAQQHFPILHDADRAIFAVLRADLLFEHVDRVHPVAMGDQNRMFVSPPDSLVVFCKSAKELLHLLGVCELFLCMRDFHELNFWVKLFAIRVKLQFVLMVFCEPILPQAFANTPRNHDFFLLRPHLVDDFDRRLDASLVGR